MYTRFCAALSKVCLQLAVCGLIALIICVQYQVFGRYVLNDTPTWAEATALLMVIYVTAFGVAVGVRDAGHIGLESLVALLPDRLRVKIEILIHLCVLTFGVIMAYWGYIWTTIKWDELKPILGVPVGMDYLPLAIAGVLIVIFSVEHILALLQGKEVKPAWH
jgi:TRAP-type transport system small permease protein